MRYVIVFIVRLYQRYISRDQGLIPRFLGINKPTCIYYPTCSEYCVIAVKRHGSLKGSFLTIKRILKCNPFNQPGEDLVPEEFRLSFPKKVS